jgi:hypothetical protein
MSCRSTTITRNNNNLFKKRGIGRLSKLKIYEWYFLHDTKIKNNQYDQDIDQPTQGRAEPSQKDGYAVRAVQIFYNNEYTNERQTSPNFSFADIEGTQEGFEA